MSIIRGAAISAVAAPERAQPGGSAGGRVVRTLFIAVGAAAASAYVARRSRSSGAPGRIPAPALSRIEARLARLEASTDASPAGAIPPAAIPPYEPRPGRLAHERRLSALERRLTAVERTRESRRAVLFAKPNGTAGEDRRHG
jgi:hypothetical protein